jgi:hypothetical protein
MAERKIHDRFNATRNSAEPAHESVPWLVTVPECRSIDSFEGRQTVTGTKEMAPRPLLAVSPFSALHSKRGPDVQLPRSCRASEQTVTDSYARSRAGTRARTRTAPYRPLGWYVPRLNRTLALRLTRCAFVCPVCSCVCRRSRRRTHVALPQNRKEPGQQSFAL